MDRQRQLAHLQGLMESQRRIEELNAKNDELRASLTDRGETVKRLNQLSLAAASLLSAVDSGAPQTEPSSLQVLTKLSASTAVTPDPDDAEPAIGKRVAGKLLTQLLGLVVQAARQKKGEVGFLTILQLEENLNALLRKAEEKELIPRTEDSAGWKKKIAEHQPLYDRIAEMTKAGPNDEGDGDGDGDGEEDDETP